MINARGIPTCECPNCGNNFFKALVAFDQDTYTIGMYHLDVECSQCGTMTTAPTPLDNPERVVRED